MKGYSKLFFSNKSCRIIFLSGQFLFCLTWRLRGILGCLPFILDGNSGDSVRKVNGTIKHISTAQPELFQNKRFVWKGCPLLPFGTFQR
jgi:hypothetical protein